MQESAGADDRELVAGIVSRDPEAFRALMDRHAPLVINLAYRFLDSFADAEDAAQDVFVRLYQSPPSLVQGAKLSTWLYRVTANRCLDLLRKKPRAQTLSLDIPVAGEDSGEIPLSEKLSDSHRNPRELVAQSELSSVTRRAVAALPDALRAPLILSIFEELSLKEIGEILHVSPKAVERRLARGRELLKVRLSAHL